MKYLILMIALTGCEVDKEVEVISTEYISGHVQSFNLKDGTRCITWKDGYGGGLSCDFKGGEK